MPNTGPGANDDGELLALFTAIAVRDHVRVSRTLDQSPWLATRTLRVGASRENASHYFLLPIHHYIYTADTALHVAAAAHDRRLAETLVARGPDVRARNRRGAEPLHYAADAGPGADQPNPNSVSELIVYLIDAGADPNTIDNSGVAPLHRAVRTRSWDAVNALVDNGADPLLKNRSGSTPLHLAVQNTGKSNSGSDAAKNEQHRIIELLLARGASPSDRDARGKTVTAAATSEWIRQLLGNY